MRSTLYLSTLAAVSQLTAAWGDVGHRTVGYLGQKYFSQEASDLVTSLLANDHGWDISDAAVWADIVKHHRPGTGQWHYIDAQDDPPNSCALTFDHDCGKTGCVVSAIMNQTALLLNDTTDFTLQKEAVMYLIHFIGDLHQPLHTEHLARGGNDIPVCFDQRCTRENLHSIWDTDIVHKINGLKHSEKHNEEQHAAKTWADSLYNKSLIVTDECHDVLDAEGCAMGWAVETNKLVCEYVLKDGVDWVKENDLGGAYYDRVAPVVESQIASAGLRLGSWMNAIAATRAELGIVVPKQAPSEGLEL